MRRRGRGLKGEVKSGCGSGYWRLESAFSGCAGACTSVGGHSGVHRSGWGRTDKSCLNGAQWASCSMAMRGGVAPHQAKASGPSSVALARPVVRLRALIAGLPCARSCEGLRGVPGVPWGDRDVPGQPPQCLVPSKSQSASGPTRGGTCARGCRGPGGGGGLDVVWGGVAACTSNRRRPTHNRRRLTQPPPSVGVWVGALHHHSKAWAHHLKAWAHHLKAWAHHSKAWAHHSKAWAHHSKALVTWWSGDCGLASANGQGGGCVDARRMPP